MPSLSTPQTQRFQVKREAILNAAAREFNQHGVKGATLADIAASVGLMTNSVTYYYRKKEDLASACFLRTIEAFGKVALAAHVMPDASQRLRHFFRLLGELFASVDTGIHPPLVLINDIRALPSPQFDEVSVAYAALFRRVRDLFKGPETASLAHADLNARAYGVLSLAHWMRAWIVRHETDEYEHVAQRVSDIVIEGSASAQSTWLPPSAEELGWRFRDDSEPTSEAFLRAASTLVNEHGYRGASVDKISALLNVTKGSFYHHNANKEDLVWSCFERSFSVIRSALNLAHPDFGTGWERSCAVMRALARFQLSDEGPLLRLAAISALEDPERRADVNKTMNRLTQRMCSGIIDGMIDGSIRPVDPTIAGHIGIGLISAAAGLRHWVPNISEDNVAELYVRPMFIGILCPPAQV